MEYFIGEVQIQGELQKTAFSKARADVEAILENNHIQKFEIPLEISNREQAGLVQKLKWHFYIRKQWEKETGRLRKGDSLYVQLPVLEHSVFLGRVFRRLAKRGIDLFFIIHDLEMLRSVADSNTSGKERLRQKIEEAGIFQYATGVIAHNPKMIEVMVSLGIPREKLISLEIFDYLMPEDQDIRTDSAYRSGTLPVVIAGNLSPQKAGYTLHLPKQADFNLYGIGYQDQKEQQITYFGAFPPDDLPSVLQGSYGLVWDGPDAETCSGSYGAYLKFNNPHKTSLYLASKLPVMIWERAALADFVRENEVGITIASLDEIPDKLSSISEETYARILANTEVMSERLKSGSFLTTAVKACRRRKRQ